MRMRGLLMLGLAAIVGGVGCDALYADEFHAHAVEDATRYARQMYPDWGDRLRVACRPTDGNGDGYVSCDVTDGRRVVSLDCAAWLWWDYGRGCRAARLAVPGGAE